MFTSNSGSFKWFKDCDSLHNVKVSAESMSADVKAAKEFLEDLDKLIMEENVNIDARFQDFLK